MARDWRIQAVLLSVQKLIAKYGTAAHLALLAAAPLFLFPFLPDEAIATVLLFLSLPAAVWTLMEPSVLDGEKLHNARERAVRGLLSDPLLWACLALVVLVGVRAFNAGIGMSYDAEHSAWSVSNARFPLFPGSVGSNGYLPFAAMVAATVLIQGCRHSLGRSARMAFLFMSSALAGLAAAIVLSLAALGNAAALSAVSMEGTSYSFAGLAFVLCFLGGITSLVAAFERKWRAVIPLFAFSIGGTAAGAFTFSSALVSFVGACAGIVLIVYAFAYTCRMVRGSAEFKYLVVCGISLALGGLLVAASLPEKGLAARTEPFMSFVLLPDRFCELRDLLNGIALKTWLKHIWIGTGIGSFSLDFRFAANAEAWALVRGGAKAVPNGWLMLLVERGLVGAVFMALPVGFLFVAYCRRLAEGVRVRFFSHPACMLAPLVWAVVGVTGVFDCSVLRADVLMAALPMLVVSANSFSKKRG